MDNNRLKPSDAITVGRNVFDQAVPDFGRYRIHQLFQLFDLADRWFRHFLMEAGWDWGHFFNQFDFHFELLLGRIKVEWLIQQSEIGFPVKNSTQDKI